MGKHAGLPTPTATLKLHGRYRKDRHGDRVDVLPPVGAPVRPGSLSDVEAALWDQVMPDLIRRGLVGESDTSELVRLVETWGLYRASVVKAKVAPTDKEIRCAVVAYGAAFDKLCTKFGLSTADRANIKLGTPVELPNSVSSFARKRAE